MKIWLIKHKGADYWVKYMPDYNITINNTEINAQLCFYRKKDAQAYLDTKSYKEFYEVVGKS